MRKLVSILILGCLVIYIGGYQLVYFCYQYNLKQEMRSYLQQHEDAAIGSYFHFAAKGQTVTNPDFSWEDPNEEFSYGGEKYDVVSITFSNDSVRICALKDDRENTLDQKMAGINRDKQNNNSGSVLSLMKFFSAFDFSPHEIQFSQPLPVNSYGCQNSSGIVNAETAIQLPPPRMLAFSI